MVPQSQTALHLPLFYRWEGQGELVQSQAVLNYAALITQTTNCDSARSGERSPTSSTSTLCTQPEHHPSLVGGRWPLLRIADPAPEEPARQEHRPWFLRSTDPGAAPQEHRPWCCSSGAPTLYHLQGRRFSGAAVVLLSILLLRSQGHCSSRARSVAPQELGSKVGIASHHPSFPLSPSRETRCGVPVRPQTLSSSSVSCRLTGEPLGLVTSSSTPPSRACV